MDELERKRIERDELKTGLTHLTAVCRDCGSKEIYWVESLTDEVPEVFKQIMEPGEYHEPRQ